MAADPAAAVNPVTALAMRRSLLVVDVTDAVDWLADVALSLCGGAPDHEIVATQLLPTQQAARLADVTGRLASLRARASSSGGQIRVAAFTSSDPAADAARMAAQEDIELVLCDGRATLRGEASRAGVPDQLIADAPCDAGLVVVPGDSAEIDKSRGIVVPFGGSEHDWAALELGAWISAKSRTPLRVAGIMSPDAGRDASRLLADASLSVQRACGVVAEPVLIHAGPEELPTSQPSTVLSSWDCRPIGAAAASAIHATDRHPFVGPGDLRPSRQPARAPDPTAGRNSVPLVDLTPGPVARARVIRRAGPDMFRGRRCEAAGRIS